MKRNKIFECEKCGHKQLLKNSKYIQIVKYPDIFDETLCCKSLPLYIQLKHKGFWITSNTGHHISTLDENCNRNSVMLADDCLLYIYKLALRHLLLSMKIITPDEIDPANLIPHVVVRKSKDDPFSKYKSVQNESFLINNIDLSVKSDFILIELDKKRDLHMTLIFSKGISKRINLIEAFINVVKLLNYCPELIQLYASLEYFGMKEIGYWYETGALYPDNIVISRNYMPIVKDVVEMKIASAASVL